MNPVTPDQIIMTIILVAGIFSLLPGVALLVAALTNIIKSVGKWFGLSFDGNSDKVAAWINLFAFLGLIALRVFNPGIAFDWLDNQAANIANALLSVSFFFAQLKLTPIAYAGIRNLLPVVGKSYSA